MADNTNTEELRNQYRADRARYIAWRLETSYLRGIAFSEKKFRDGIALHNGGMVNGGWASKVPESPEAWVAATKSYVEREIAPERQEPIDEYDDEGYMGTGMSESTYYRAAGSAEFDY